MSGRSYPKIPEGNWWAIRSQFKKTIPSTVTPTYLSSLLLLGDGAAKNLIPVLKQLRIIDEVGAPTDVAKLWRMDNTYKAVCISMRNEIYPDELRNLFQGPYYNKKDIEGWFMNDTGVGEAAAKMMASTFILLSTGEIKNETEMRSVRTHSSFAQGVDTAKGEKAKKEQVLIVPGAPSPAMETRSESPSVRVELQINISSETSLEQIEAIFSNISKYLCARR